ncbi:hypothetical protein [uncultured Brevibacillus sp.]|uniref:hypothetical protein n=1 Tax=uncultured Brevibacillus sp. TaxID=169970 RepID=UPI002592F128|nr:hypothetical protein [uncultured Brevibacillus sp.]
MDRNYALVSLSRGATEDKEEVPITEILKEFQSEGSSVLLIGWVETYETEIQAYRAVKELKERNFNPDHFDFYYNTRA